MFQGGPALSRYFSRRSSAGIHYFIFLVAPGYQPENLFLIPKKARPGFPGQAIFVMGNSDFPTRPRPLWGR
jgi:hypothetical protein